MRRICTTLLTLTLLSLPAMADETLEGRTHAFLAPTGETVATPFYEIRYDFVLQKAAQALAAAE